MNDQKNAKNKLLELLKDIGHDDNKINSEIADFHTESVNPARTTLTVTFPHGLILKGSGQANRKADAEIIASQEILNQLPKHYPELIVDWNKLMVEAQRGDALIKLGIYLSDDFKKPSDKSLELQRTETNERLAKVYDRWIAEKDPDLAGWGTHMDVHKKASVVEALIWRRFNDKVIAEGASERLKTLLKSIDFNISQ